MPMVSLFDLFSLFCGLAIFLYGMQQGEKNLKLIGGSDLRKAISIITRHRLSAYVAGLGTTLLTQSSSATTVMLVSLASAQLMTLGQSLGMILGSDLGTTFTVQLFAFKFYEVAPLLIAVGFFSSFSRRELFSGYGMLVLSLGFIFFGMHMMSEAVTPLRSHPAFEHIIKVSFSNPWFGLLAGALITGIIQSSAATLAIVIALAQTFQASGEFIPTAPQLLPLVMGANLGTCVTAFLSTFKAELEGIRVAWAHFLFKLLGTMVVFPVCWFISPINQFLPQSPALQIATLHTMFNIFISLLFLPFLGPFEKLLIKHITPGKKAAQRFHVTYLHDNVLSLPILAISQAVKEIERMAERVTNMVEKSYQLIEHFDRFEKTHIEKFDDEVDFLHEQIVTFLTKIARKELNPQQASKAYQMIMITTDLEHIGDIISKNIIHLAEKIENSPMPLSNEGKREILEYFQITITSFKEVIAAFTMDDQEIARAVFNKKVTSKEIFSELFNRHMDRLYLRKPESLKTTSIHIDLLEEIQRINHFTFRVAAHLLQIHKAE